MQKVDTAELRRLHEAATKGEWVAPDSGHDCLYASAEMMEQRRPIAYFVRLTNRKFIAAAHNALPALLDELEAAREEVREESNRWVSVIRGIDPEALCDFHDEHGSQEYLKAWLDARDRRMKAIGAAEEWELEAGIAKAAGRDRITYQREYLEQRAAQLRQEAEDGK